jgi:hypothetical protein
MSPLSVLGSSVAQFHEGIQPGMWHEGANPMRCAAQEKGICMRHHKSIASLGCLATIVAALFTGASVVAQRTHELQASCRVITNRMVIRTAVEVAWWWRWALGIPVALQDLR